MASGRRLCRTMNLKHYLAGKGELTTTAIVKLAKAQKRPTTGPRWSRKRLSGNIARLWDNLGDDSVDLFLTDPPYNSIELFGELARLAAAKLKDGGLCLAYWRSTLLASRVGSNGKAPFVPLGFSASVSAVPIGRSIPDESKTLGSRLSCSAKGRGPAGWIVDLLESGGREKTTRLAEIVDGLRITSSTS